MIAYLTGSLLKKDPQSVIVDVGGVGYEVFIPISTFYALPEENEGVRLKIYTHVRDDALVLFGFQTTLEKDLFGMLISVSGIGPKLAVNILSGMGPQELLHVIAQGDAGRLRAIPGVGKKTADRIALELKDGALKAVHEKEVPSVSMPEGPDQSLVEDTLSALVNLGYSTRSANAAIEKARGRLTEVSLESLIREALTLLA
ncbi:MAG: Holliday junction branch migration protein RuvA [Deltaproteobacteria bacterium]|nr:Holliday junction branch migration protein RuvA [Deltaproteobacteria bacterium]